MGTSKKSKKISTIVPDDYILGLSVVVPPPPTSNSLGKVVEKTSLEGIQEDPPSAIHICAPCLHSPVIEDESTSSASASSVSRVDAQDTTDKVVILAYESQDDSDTLKKMRIDCSPAEVLESIPHVEGRMVVPNIDLAHFSVDCCSDFSCSGSSGGHSCSYSGGFKRSDDVIGKELQQKREDADIEELS